MGALGNVLGNGVMRKAFSTPAVEKALRPVIGIEEFGAGIVGGEPPHERTTRAAAWARQHAS